MAAANFSSDISDVLSSQLECPVCKELCSPPIYMCANGHNVCSACQPNLTSCPVCRIPGRPVNRNLFAETVSENAWVACKNAEQGCREALKAKQMADHLAGCAFGYRCVLCYCVWRGRVDHLVDHVRNVHREHYLVVGETGALFTSDSLAERIERSTKGRRRRVIGPCYIRKPIAMATKAYKTVMLAYGNHYFWLHTQRPEATALQVQLRLLPLTESPGFFYRLTFRSVDNTKTSTYTNKVRTLEAPAFSDVVFDAKNSCEEFLSGEFLNGEFLSGEFLNGEFLSGEFLNGDGQLRFTINVCRAGDEKEWAGDEKEGAGDEKEGAGDEKEGAGDEKEWAGDEKEGAGDEKEGAGDEKEWAGDEKEGAGDEKEGAWDEKEGAGDEKEWAGDEKEGAGDEKEGAGDEKEWAGDEKEGAGDEKEGAGDEKEGAGDEEGAVAPVVGCLRGNEEELKYKYSIGVARSVGFAGRFAD